MVNTSISDRGNLFAPVANTNCLHIEPFTTSFSKMKTTSRYICDTIYSFTICKLIIDLLTLSSNFITNMHPAFKAVFGLVLYLFGEIPLIYAARSTKYWHGFHKGLELSTASEFCKNLRFQAHYNRHPMTYMEELQQTWCDGEQEGIQSRPLFLYSLECTRYHTTQFLFTIILIGILVLLTRHRSSQRTTPDNSVAGSGTCPAVRSTGVKHAGLNVSGSSRGSSSFDFSKESFGTPSRECNEATAQKLAAKKNRMHMEGPAKAGKLCKTKLEVTENKDQLSESSRNAEMKAIVGDLEQRLREQQKATLDWKEKAGRSSNTTSRMRYDSTRKVHKQKLQQYHVGRPQMHAEVKQHEQGEVKQQEQAEPKRASPQRSDVETPLSTMTSKPSTEERALPQRIHELESHAKDALTSNKSQLQADLEAGKKLPQNESVEKADLLTKVSKLERTVEDMKIEIAQAIECRAGLASKVATQEQQAQVYIQSIAMLQAQLDERDSVIHAKEKQLSIAESGMMAMLQEKANYQAEQGRMSTYCANLDAENKQCKERLEGLGKQLTEREFELEASKMELELSEDASRKEEEKLRDELDQNHRRELRMFEQDHHARFQEYTAIKKKAQKDIELLGQESNLRAELERKLQQERDTSNALRKKISQSRNTEDRMDETGDNTWVQRASEAELMLRTRDLEIKALQHKVMVLEREISGKTIVPPPQPRAIQPLRITSVPGTSAAPASPPIASNATPSPSGAPKGLDFAHLDEARVRREVSSYVQTALESVTRWNRACFAGSVGAEKVVKNFATMLSNWEYLQEDIIRDEKLLRAVKNVVGLEGRWTTAPTPVEIMGGKEPARDRMVKIAKRVLARIEGTGEEDGSKGVKRMR